MRVICDAPGQTCNRLWTYLPSIAQCLAENKKMVIIFFDWTIEDFPNLLHAPFIYFPLYQKWFLKLPKGWGWYKQLTWTVTHNNTWNKIFKLLGFTKGWDTMTDTRYLSETKPKLKHIFRPRKEITDKAEVFMSNIRKDADLVIGVHIRHGDYKTFENGRYYYTLEEYYQFMQNIQQVYKDKRVVFFISSNESFDTQLFKDCRCFRFGKEPSGDILDLYTLSLCDRIVGPWSTYSRWASFFGEVPLCCIKERSQSLAEDSFSIVTDFYHFKSGENTVDYWLSYT